MSASVTSEFTERLQTGTVTTKRLVFSANTMEEAVAGWKLAGSPGATVSTMFWTAPELESYLTSRINEYLERQKEAILSGEFSIDYVSPDATGIPHGRASTPVDPARTVPRT